MAAGISVRVGIDADKPQGAYGEPGFFLQFAAAGCLDGLAHIDEAAGKRVAAAERARACGG